MPIDRSKFATIIQDAVAQKRVIKWGYLRQFGGLYPTQCDTVGAHSNTVSVLAAVLGFEYAEDIESATGVRLRLDDVTLLSIFHDLGESRSGDTGAYSHAIRGFCNLHSLEREGLHATVAGFRIEQRVMSLFDDYRGYRTPEAIIVHVADNLEGFEKGAHAGAMHSPLRQTWSDITKSNLHMYREIAAKNDACGRVCVFVVDNILLPGIRAICDAYAINEADILGANEKAPALAEASI
jgi:5'-deoxynucleotidase YfbR-like HD superfamily hydrolase